MADDKPGGTDQPAGTEKPAEQKPAGDTPPAPKPAEPKPGDTPSDQQPAESKDPASQDGTPPAAPKAPDTYALTVPDGAQTYLDDEDLKTLEATARANNWTNEQAQAVLEQHADTLAAQSAAFRAVTEKDPTYGGDHLIETQRLATLALDRVRPADTDQGQALRRLLAKSGYGNKLEVVSFLADLGKLMAEDQPHGGGGTKPTGPARTAKSTSDVGAVLYGKS
jgi:hypothetical protein